MKKLKKTKVVQACIVRHNDEACADQTGADASSQDNPHEGVFIRYRQAATAATE